MLSHLPTWLTVVNVLTVLGGVSALCSVMAPVLSSLGLTSAGHVVASVGVDVAKLLNVVRGGLDVPDQEKNPPKPAGFVRLHALVLVALVGMAGCATMKLFGASVVNCEKQDLPTLEAVAPQVVHALLQQDYATAVDELVSQQGEVIQCAVALIKAKPPTPGVAVAIAQNRSAQYLSAKGITVTNVPAPR